jgi:glycosyltransferase involved in cell wall biosynthesis
LLSRTLRNQKTLRQTIKKYHPDVIFCGGMDGIGFNTYSTALHSGYPVHTWLGDTWLGQAWRDLRRYDAWVDFRFGGRRPGWRSFLKRLMGWYGQRKGLYSEQKPNRLGSVSAISEYVLEDLRQSGAPVPPDTKVVPVCLHSSFTKSDSEVIGHSKVRASHLRALFVSRIERPKGPDTALQSIAEAKKLGGDIRLTFAGLQMEQLKGELEKEACALGVSDRITWFGTPSQTQLVELYQNHDVFLFPSRIKEGLGVVNCEAIACGLPIIGTAHSGSAEVIIPDETGFRVNMDDAVAIGKYLVMLDRDRELLETLSGSATRFANRFLQKPVIDLLESQLYAISKLKE